MVNLFKHFGIGIFVFALALSITGCANPTDSGTPDNGSGNSIPDDNDDGDDGDIPDDGDDTGNVIILDIPDTFIITGREEAFRATFNGVTVPGAKDMPIQDVINAVRTQAGGGAVSIHFYGGEDALYIGSDWVNFADEGGESWGEITLTGRISSSNPNSSQATVALSSATTVHSAAYIANISTGSNNRALRNNSTGVVNIIDGIVKTSFRGVAVLHNSTGSVNISGGTVTAGGTNGIAVRNDNSGRISVSGTATVTSANTSTSQGTIVLSSSGRDTGVRLEITGGEVLNTSNGTNSRVINNSSTGAVRISGDAVLSGGQGTIVRNAGSGTVSIDGNAMLSATGSTSVIVRNMDSGALRIGGNATLLATGRGARAIQSSAESTGIISIYGEAKIISANQERIQGTILLSGDGGSGRRLEITGGEVLNTADHAEATAVHNTSADSVEISGGYVSGRIAIRNPGGGPVNITPPAEVKGELIGENINALGISD